MSTKKVGVIRATSVAAISKVIKHLELGLFLSEFSFLPEDYKYDFGEGGELTRCGLMGRTDDGQNIFAVCYLIYGGLPSGSSKFPFSRIWIEIEDQDNPSTEGCMYFEYIRRRENGKPKSELIRLDVCPYNPSLPAC